MTVGELIAKLSQVSDLNADIILSDDGSGLEDITEDTEHNVVLFQFSLPE